MEKAQFYGRRCGKTLRAHRRFLLSSLLPDYEIKLETLPQDSTKRIAPGCFFENFQEYPVWLEIGFGSGEHLFWQAKSHPQVHFIGAEPYMNGVSRILLSLEELPLKNLKIYCDDVCALFPVFPLQSLDRVFLLFPDPWPKKRHQKRRLINHVVLDVLSPLMKPGAELRIVSDDKIYLHWVFKIMGQRLDFSWDIEDVNTCKIPFCDSYPTRYEQKRIKGDPLYLSYNKVLQGGSKIS